MPRLIRIRESNAIATCFNRSVECMSDELPNWFKPLQYILEDRSFDEMVIRLADVRYLITPAAAGAAEGEQDELFN